MKTPELEIKAFLEKVIAKFPLLKFRCGFGNSENAYIIEVHPQNEYFNNEDYAKEEYFFTKEFEDKYKDIDIIFITEDDILSIKEVVFTVGYDSIKMQSNDRKFNSSFSPWNRNSSYFLAA